MSMTGTSVIISIRGRHDLPGSGAEPVEQTARGTLRREAGAWLLSYREEGADGAQTEMRIEPGKIVLSRQGAFRSRMVFREGRRYLSDYDTPYGRMPMEVCAARAQARMEEDGGEIELDYTVALAGQSAGSHVLRIEVRRDAGEE